MEFIPFGAADKIRLTVEIVKTIIAVPTKTGKSCSDRDAIKFMMLCQAQRLNPFAGDAFLTGYDSKDGGAKFSLITAHVAFQKRAESSPDFEGMESGIILQSVDGIIFEREGDFSIAPEKVVGGWARVYRKGRKPTYRRLSVEQRRPAYPTPFWEGIKAAEQIVKCAEADAMRATFPTLLGGLHGDAEMVSVDTTNVADTPARLMAASASSPPPKHVLLESVPEASKTDEPPAQSPQAEVESIVIAAGYTFDDLLNWGKETGHITEPNAANMTCFDDVPDKVAIMLVRARAGLIQGIKKQKAGAK